MSSRESPEAGHRLLCGDSTDALVAEKVLKGIKPQMVFADPPYGMRLDADYSSEKSTLKMLRGKGLLTVFCSEPERPFFVPSPGIRFAERAEGVKGPKR